MKKSFLLGVLLSLIALTLFAQTDVVDPCIGSINIEDGDSVSLEIMIAEGICFTIHDDCGTPPMVISGVDPATVEIRIEHDGVVNEYNPYTDPIPAHSGVGGCLNPAEIWEEGVYSVCVRADDYNDNHLEHCFEFTIVRVPVIDDDIWSPCMTYSNIIDGEELTLSEIGTDNFCFHIDDDCSGADFFSGVDLTSVHITLTHGGIAETITTELFPRAEHYGVGACFGYEWSTGEYEICISGVDYAGNDFNECVTFVVTDDTPDDICEPIFINVEPTTDCMTPEHAIAVSIIDPYDPPECYYSGIDLETIEVWADFAGDITDDCTITAIDNGYRILWTHGDTTLTPGFTFRFSVEGNDNAGNRSGWVDTFTVCDDDTMPLDLCPPVLVEYWPGDCVPVTGGHMGVMIEDHFHTEECPIVSGLDMESISIYANDYDITRIASVTHTGGAANIIWTPSEALTPGSTINLCVNIDDIAGNHAELCHEFTVCGEDTTTPVDEVPPCLHEATTADYGEVTFEHLDEYGYCLVIHDNCEPGTIISGVDLESMVITLTQGGMSHTFTPEGTAAGDAGAIFCINPEEWFAGEYVLCFVVADNAGNETDGCIHFTVVDEVLEDECPPIHIFSYPGDRVECIGPDDLVGIEMQDNDSPSCVYSGLDNETMEAWYQVHDGVIDITEDIEIVLRDGVNSYIWDPSYIAAGEEFIYCIAVSDLVGNRTAWCDTYVVCEDDTISPDTLDTTPPCGDWSFEDDDMLELGSLVTLHLCDACPDAYGITGVVEESIEVQVTDCETGDIIEAPYELIDLDCAGYAIFFDTDIWEAGHCYTVCVYAEDGAGNIFEECQSFTIDGTALEDLCEPIVTSIIPERECVHVGAEVAFTFIDPLDLPECYRSGLDPESITGFIGSDEVTDDLFIAEHELGLLVGYSTDAYEPGDIFEICVVIADNAGNYTDICHEFTICEDDTIYPDTLDTTQPCLDWSFEDGAVIDPAIETFNVGIAICDACDGAREITGVDSATIEITVTDCETGDAYIAEYTIEELDCYGYAIHFDGLITGFDCNEVCIRVEDHAGNVTEECRTYTFDDTPEDLCEPIVTSIIPERECVHVGDEVAFTFIDPLDLPECYRSGLDPESITGFIGSDEVTDDLFIAEHELGLLVGYSTDAYEPGDIFEICVVIADNAGNYTDICHEFTICEDDTIYPDTLDTTPPCGDWSFEDDDMLELGALVTLHLCDACPDAYGITGVVEESIEVQVTDCETGDIVEAPYEIEGIYCAGYAIFFDTETWEAGHCYTVCVYAEDGAGNEFEECRSFTIDGMPPIDREAPCLVHYLPEDDAVVGEFSVDFTLCDDCTPGTYHSGIDASSVIFWVNDMAFTPMHYASTDCDGYHFYHDAIFSTPGEYHICVSGADLAGNDMEYCWDVTVEGSGEFSLISPEPDSYTSCDGIVVVIGIPHEIPTSFEFYIDGMRYDLRSSEVTSDSAHIFFTPSSPFDEGEVIVEVLDYEWSFFVDTSAPIIELVYPEVGTIYGGYGNIRVLIDDEISTVDIGSIYAVLDDYTLIPGMPGVTYHMSSHELIIDPELAGVDLVEGETVELCVHASDLMDYCDPNEGSDCWDIELASPALYTISGHVTIDDDTGDPLEGIIVHLYDYLAPFVPIYETETDADGYYELDVTVGNYSMSVQDYDFEYATEFYEDETNPLEADPIHINSSSPSLTIIDYELAPVLVTMYRITGTVTNILGDPIEGCYVVAISSDEDEEEWSVTDRTDSLGRYEFLLEEGNYYILAHQMGYMPSFYGGGMMWEDMEPIDIATDVDSFNIILEEVSHDPGAWFMRMRILDEDSMDVSFTEKPIKGVRFYINDLTTGYHYATISDNNGYVNLSGIADGMYTVDVDKVAYEVVTDVYDVNPENLDEELNIFMRRVTHNIDELPSTVPSQLNIVASPNPFNPSTVLSFDIASPADVVVEINDINGHTIWSADLGYLSNGNHSVTFEGGDLPAGLYMASVKTDKSYSARKIILIK